MAVVITLVLGACAGDDSGASQGTTKLANPTTGPAETAPAETADRGENPEPPPLAERAQLGTVTSSGGGCALEIDAETIRAGAGRLTVVNETDRSVVFELFRLASEATFGSLEAGDLVASFGPSNPTSNFFLVEREVRPGASGTITDNFTTGDAFAVVCLNRHPHDGPLGLGTQYAPFAVVGPIVVP